MTSHDDYDARAQAHRPTDAEQLRGEIHRLLAQGLKRRDVATALRMHMYDLNNLIGPPPC